MTTYSKILGVVRDTQGVAQGNKPVFVYETGTNMLASLFLDDDVTSMPNPFQTGFDGSYGFNIAVGSYDIAIQTDAYTIQLLTNVPAVGAGTSGVTAVTGTSPIVSSGGSTPAISLANTAVTPGSYGDSTHVAAVTVDAMGRVTAASNVAVSGGGGGVTSLAGLTGALTLGSSDSSVTVTPSGTNIDLKAAGGGGSGAPLLTTIADGNISQLASGNYTIGYRFRPIAPISCTGIQLRWLGSATTLTVTLWDHTGASVVSESMPVSTIGVRTHAWTGGPVALTPGNDYYVTYSDTAGSPQYTDASTTSIVPVGAFSPPGYLLLGAIFSTGTNVFPATPATTSMYFIDPLF
jgi:hypothetical protein